MPAQIDGRHRPLNKEGVSVDPMFVVGVDSSGGAIWAAPVLGETWADPTVPWDARAYSDVEVQIAGTITTPYQAVRSLDGTAWFNCLAYEEDGVSHATIDAPGIYSLGRGYLKFTAGEGATITRRAA